MKFVSLLFIVVVSATIVGIMKILSIMFLFYFCLAADDVTDYLQRFNYLSETPEGLISREEALINFQEYYHLPFYPNKKTIELLGKPRCGVSDAAFSIRSTWTKKHLKWYFPQADYPMKNVAATAFRVWQNVSGLTFENNRNSLDIVALVADGPKNHSKYDKCQQGLCPYEFDAKGVVLRHAFFHFNKTCKELILLTCFKIPYEHQKLIGAVNRYTGKIFPFFEDNYYTEISENTLQVKYYGYFSRQFHEIPSDGAFRYINGMLYFFQNDRNFSLSLF